MRASNQISKRIFIKPSKIVSKLCGAKYDQNIAIEVLVEKNRVAECSLSRKKKCPSLSWKSNSKQIEGQSRELERIKTENIEA